MDGEVDMDGEMMDGIEVCLGSHEAKDGWLFGSSRSDLKLSRDLPPSSKVVVSEFLTCSSGLLLEQMIDTEVRNMGQITRLK